MARFFIHRPVFAWVLAIVTMLGGILGLLNLPISQYPEVSPPTVRISATYSGAAAAAVQNSVTSTIEDAMTGLDGMIYMTSSATSGSSSISLVFDQDTDPETAQTEVQNKVQLILSQLPDSVQDAGVRVSRSTSSILMVGALVSADDSYSTIELADLLDTSVEGPVQRIEGVGSINTFGSGYAMRIWLDPDSLFQFALTPGDITSAVEAQNTTVGGPPRGCRPDRDRTGKLWRRRPIQPPQRRRFRRQPQHRGQRGGNRQTGPRRAGRAEIQLSRGRERRIRL